jgi:hypothetical protein
MTRVTWYDQHMANTGGRRRARGAVDQLPSGAYRVRVYAGLDPLTKKAA